MWISFDVGIKHLAYCVFNLATTTTPESTYSIHDWDVISLIPEANNIPQVCCNGLTKKKTPCMKTARYTFRDQSFCESHAKEVALLPEKKYTAAYWRTLSVSDIQQEYTRLIPQGNITTKAGRIQALEEYYKSRVCRPIIRSKVVKANEVDLVTLGRNLAAVLDQRELWKDITGVLIENQISKIATRMKTIQGMLAQYFIMRSPMAKIEFVSSSNKLKRLPVCILPVSEVEAPSYKRNKQDGVVACEKILNTIAENGKWIERWNARQAKKDDLADCFLQGWVYLHGR